MIATASTGSGEVLRRREGSGRGAGARWPCVRLAEVFGRVLFALISGLALDVAHVEKVRRQNRTRDLFPQFIAHREIHYC